MFSNSLHELTACIYYKLAIERGLRGCHPDGELQAHCLREPAAGGGDYHCRVASDEDLHAATR